MEMMSNRSQAFPIDGAFASVILITAVSIAIISTGISPQEAASTQDSEVENIPVSEVKTALIASHRDGSLKETVTSWDSSAGEFQMESTFSDDGVLVTYPDNALGRKMTAIEDKYDVQINIRINPQSNNTKTVGNKYETQTIPVVVSTFGSGDRSVASEPIAISNKTRLGGEAFGHSIRSTPAKTSVDDSLTTVEASSTYPVPPGADPFDDGRVYNNLLVEAVIYE